MALNYDNYLEIYRRNQSRYQKPQEAEPEVEPQAQVEEQEDRGGTFTNAFARGVDNMQASLWGFTKAVGDFLEVDLLSRWGDEGIQRNVEEILKNPAKIESWDDVDSLADFGTYFVEALGEQAPQLLVDIPLVLATPASGGAAAAGIAARRAALAGVGKTAKRLLGERAYSNFRKAAPALLAANLYAQSAGETQLEMEAEGVDAPGTALLAGIPKAALEKVGLEYLVAGKSIMPKWAGELPKKAMEKLGVAKIREVARATGLPVEETAKRAGMVLAAAGIGMANEGSVEALQTVLDKIAVSTKKSGYDIFSDENLREIREAAIKGALVGGTYSGAQNAIQQYAEYRNQRAEQDREELRRIIERQPAEPSTLDPEPVIETVAPAAASTSTEGGGFPGLNARDRGAPYAAPTLASVLAVTPGPATVAEAPATVIEPPATVVDAPAEGGGFPGLQRFDQDAPIPEPQADIDAQARALADPNSAKKAMQITHGSPMPTPGILDDSVFVVDAENGPILTFDLDIAEQIKRSGDIRTVGSVLYNNPNGKDGTDGTVVLVRDENGAVMHEELTNRQRLLDSIAYARAVAATNGKVEVSTAQAQVEDRQRRVDAEELGLVQRAMQQLGPQLETIPEQERAAVWESFVGELKQQTPAMRRQILTAAADPAQPDVAQRLVARAYDTYRSQQAQAPAPRMSDTIETDEAVVDESEFVAPAAPQDDAIEDGYEDDPRDARYPATVAPGQRDKNLISPRALKAVPAKQNWVPETLPTGYPGEFAPNVFKSEKEALTTARALNRLGGIQYRLPKRSNGQTAFIYDRETKKKYWQLEAVQDRTQDPEFDGARTPEEFIEDTLHQGMRKAAMIRRWLDRLYKQSFKDPTVDTKLIDVLENSVITLTRGDEVIQVDAADITVAGARLLDADNQEMETHYPAFLEGMSAIMAEGWKPVTGMVNTAPGNARASAFMDMFDPNLVIMHGALRNAGYEKTVFRIRDFAPLPSQLRQLKKEIAAKQEQLDALQLTAYGKKLAKARSTSLEKGAAAVESAYLQYEKLAAVAESEESVAALGTLLNRITGYLDIIKHDLKKTSRALKEDTPEIIKLRQELDELKSELPYSEKLKALQDQYMDVVGALQRYEQFFAKFDKNTRPMEWAVVSRLVNRTSYSGNERRDQTGRVIDQQNLSETKGLLSELRRLQNKLGKELKDLGAAVKIEPDSAIVAQESSKQDIELGAQVTESGIMTEEPEERAPELADYTPSNMAVKKAPKSPEKTYGQIDERVSGFVDFALQDLGLDIQVSVVEANDQAAKAALDDGVISTDDWHQIRRDFLQTEKPKLGMVIITGPRSAVIVVPAGKTDADFANQIWTIGHELGHLVKSATYHTLPPALQVRMEAAYARAKKSNPAYQGPGGFDEWYSDQLARYFVDNPPDKNSHFAKVAGLLKQLHERIKTWLKSAGNKMMPRSRTFREMLDTLKEQKTFQTVKDLRGDQRYYYMTFAGINEEQREAAGRAADNLKKWLGDRWGKQVLRPFLTGDSELRILGTIGEKIANLFYWRSETTKPTTKPPHFTQMNVNGGLWRSKLDKTLAPYSKDELQQAFDELAREKPTSPAALAIRDFLDEFHTKFIKETMPLVRFEPNYFPRYYDVLRMEEYADEFVAILAKHGVKDPRAVYKNIVSADGQLDFTMSSGPSARLQHERVFRDPALIRDLVDAGFLNNNPVETLESYLSNALQRGTYENQISGYRYPAGYRTLGRILREADELDKAAERADKARRRELYLERQLVPVLDRTGLSLQELAESDYPEANAAARLIRAQQDVDFYRSRPSSEDYIQRHLDRNKEIVDQYLKKHKLTFDGALQSGYLRASEVRGYTEYQIYDPNMALSNYSKEGLDNLLEHMYRQGLPAEVDDYQEAVTLGVIRESKTGKIEFQKNGEWVTFVPPEGKRDYLTLQDIDRVHQVINGYMGKLGLSINPRFNRYQSTAMMLTNWVTLAFSTVSSLVELPLLIRQAHGKEQRKALWQSFKQVFANREEVTRAYEMLGIVEERTNSQILASMYGYHNATKFARQGNDLLFRVNGQRWFTNTSRLVAAHFGQQFLKHHATQARNGNEDSAHYLKTMGVTHQEVQRWIDIGEPLLTTDNQFTQDGELIYRMTTAMHRFIDSSVLRPNRAERPVWGNDPYFALFFHLKSYAYSLQKNVFSGIWREGKRRGQQHGAGAALAYFGGVAAWFFAFAVLSNELREELMYRLGGNGYRPSDSMDFDEYLLHLATNRVGIGASTSPWFDMLTNKHHHTLAPIGFSPTLGKVDSILNADSGLDALFGMTPLVSQSPGLQWQIKDWMGD